MLSQEPSSAHIPEKCHLPSPYFAASTGQQNPLAQSFLISQHVLQKRRNGFSEYKCDPRKCQSILSSFFSHSWCYWQDRWMQQTFFWNTFLLVLLYIPLLLLNLSFLFSWVCSLSLSSEEINPSPFHLSLPLILLKVIALFLTFFPVNEVQFCAEMAILL